MDLLVNQLIEQAQLHENAGQPVNCLLLGFDSLISDLVFILELV